MRALRLILIASSLSLVPALAGGCDKPLFSDDVPRSPYERYAVLRGQQRPTTEQDMFGNDQPALRARLKPMDQP